MRTTIWRAATIILAFSGCAEPVSDLGAVVSIAPESAYRALPTLVLADESSVCGSDEEPCSKPSFHIAALHPDGAVAFWGLDGKAPQLFLATSTELLRLGRQGGGPGEYRMPLALGIAEDGEVRVADVMQRRILSYGRNGGSVATMSVDLPPGLFDLGFVAGELRAFATAVPSTKGDSVPVSVFALTAGSGKSRELYTLRTRQPGYGMADMRPAPSPFATSARFQFRRDGHLFVTEGTAFRVDEYDPRGTLIASFGFDVEPRHVSESELKAALLEQTRRIPDPRMRAAFESSTQRGVSRHPALTRVVPLDNGEVWVRESPREAADSVQWVVFAAPARPRGKVWLASGEMVLGSLGERILVSREDEGAGMATLRWMRVSP